MKNEIQNNQNINNNDQSSSLDQEHNQITGFVKYGTKEKNFHLIIGDISCTTVYDVESIEKLLTKE